MASASPSELTQSGTVTLDGSQSFDASGDTLSYQWSQVSGPTVSISDAQSAVASITPQDNGSYQFQLTVSDGSHSSTAQVTVSVAVAVGPAGTPSLNPNPSSSGDYTVSWAALAFATKYELEQSSDGGNNWSEPYYDTSEQWNATGMTNGTYEYRVRGHNSLGYGAWSVTSSETVSVPPGIPAAPSIAPSPSTSGSYRVSWTGLANITSYDLDEKQGSNGWGTPYSGPGTQWNASGKTDGTYYYKVRACNSDGCSNWGASTSVKVILTPGPVSVSLSPSQSISGGQYTVSWSASSGATDYQMESVPTAVGATPDFSGAPKVDEGGSQSVTVTAPPETTAHEIWYRVEACTAQVNGQDNCSAWSSAVGETVQPSGGCGLSTTTAPGTGGGAAGTQSIPCGATTQVQEGGDPSITWDALGEARSIDTGGAQPIQLTYDPEGDLVNNTHAGGGRYLGQWVKLVDASDWSARIIVQGQVVAVVKDTAGTQSTQYLVQDGLGSTVALAQGNGTLIGRIAYSPWGRFVDPQNGTAPVSATSVAAQTTVTYTGHELIAGTGLIDMGARIYDPETGLFISPDPTVAHPYDSQDLNQYAYVEDNPMTYVDPTGLDRSLCDGPVPCNTNYYDWEWIAENSTGVACNGGQSVCVVNFHGPASVQDTNGQYLYSSKGHFWYVKTSQSMWYAIPPGQIDTARFIAEQIQGAVAQAAFYRGEQTGEAWAMMAQQARMARAAANGPIRLSQAQYNTISSNTWWANTATDIGVAEGLGIAGGGLGDLVGAGEGAFSGIEETVDLAPQTIFKTEHYASRLEAAGVDVLKAESAVGQDVNAMRPYMEIGADIRGRITIDDALIEYRVRQLSSQVINVGTIFPVSP